LKHQLQIWRNIEYIIIRSFSSTWFCRQNTFRFCCRSTLQKHISVIHDKERPYRCDLCPSAAFGQKVPTIDIYDFYWASGSLSR
jgi:hypothetical protein